MTRQVALSRLASYANGRAFKPEEMTPVGLPIIRIRQMVDRTAETDLYDGPVDARHLVKDGDLLFSWSATLAVDLWDRGPGVLNQHLFNVHPANGIDKRWLRWGLLTSIPRFRTLMHGSAMTHITKEMLRDVALPVPSLDEQCCIADFLDDHVALLDHAIKLRQQQIALTEEHRRAVIANVMFAPGSKATKLGRLAHVELGRQRSPEHEEGDHLTPYLRSANVQDGELLLEDVKEMNFTPAEQKVYALALGDILVTEASGSADAVGATAVWQQQLPEVVCFQNTLIRVRPRLEGKYSSEYLAWWARASHASGAMKVWATGANILHLGSAGLRAMPVPVRSHPEQEVAVAACATVDQQAQVLTRLHRKSLELLRERKEALIAATVSGEIDVTTARSVA